MTENRLAGNPYAPPQAAVDDVVPGEDRAVRIRKQHLLHEVRLKSVGSLYYLGFLILAMSGVFHLFPMEPSGARGLDATFALIVVLAAVFAVIGYGFSSLRWWVLVPGAIVTALGLAAFPIGTLINGYILYLVLCRKGRTVLRKDYAAIMAATPTLKYQRGLSGWLAIVILFAGFALLLFALR